MVLPSLNVPHSGCPLLAHPSGEVARAATSDHPIGVSGQPSASAIGFGIAITRGVSMKDTASPAISGSPASARRWLRIAPQLEDAGDQITGWGSLSPDQPSARRSAASPDALE